MEKLTDYENRILLSLKRKYKADEELGLIFSAIGAKDYEIGMLKSEIAELKDLIEKKNKKLDELRVHVRKLQGVGATKIGWH